MQIAFQKHVQSMIKVMEVVGNPFEEDSQDLLLADEELLITKGDDVLRKPPLLDTSAMVPCNHEEADTRYMLHAAHAAHNGDKKIRICTVDPDVIVLNEETEIWVAFGSGKTFRFLAAHEMAWALGPEKAQALLMFHADGLRHGLLLRRTWKEDSMASVDSAT
ncbi:unnamed protein product [Ceutorhynchus assimilis]|uniref:Uncharacterized protein n=1 Tax=Ceutorhynchus assimilis TaxID=467358 RepID=A0A9N9MS61_9CUCU|nr:unnamed protein product [Ceutorhynchus assimilis]